MHFFKLFSFPSCKNWVRTLSFCLLAFYQIFISFTICTHSLSLTHRKRALFMRPAWTKHIHNTEYMWIRFFGTYRVRVNKWRKKPYRRDVSNGKCQIQHKQAAPHTYTFLARTWVIFFVVAVYVSVSLALCYCYAVRWWWVVCFSALRRCQHCAQCIQTAIFELVTESLLVKNKQEMLFFYFFLVKWIILIRSLKKNAFLQIKSLMFQITSNNMKKTVKLFNSFALPNKLLIILVIKAKLLKENWFKSKLFPFGSKWKQTSSQLVKHIQVLCQIELSFHRKQSYW